MRFASSVFPLAAALVACLVATPGRADLCTAAAQLAGIRDAYLSLDRETGRARQDAAIALLSLHLPSARPADLADEMEKAGISSPEARLVEILDAAADRARDVITGQAVSAGRTEHDVHRYWLSSLIHSTGCHEEWQDNLQRRLTTGVSVVPPPEPEKQSAIDVLKYLAIGAAAIALGAAAYCIRKSRTFRKGEMQRMPRRSVLLDARIDCPALGAAGQIDIRLLDLSRGGAKAAWSDAPEVGTSLVLSVEGVDIPSSVVWRNEFYAGLLFDTHLEADVLDRLTGVTDP